MNDFFIQFKTMELIIIKHYNDFYIHFNYFEC